jgi:fumarate hydratase class II
MNVNEVVANRGHVLQGGKLTDADKVLKANDDVNKSQSSNDTFPTAMHIAAYTAGEGHIARSDETPRHPGKKSNDFKDIVKTGRTHFMDATPLTFGAGVQRLRAAAQQRHPRQWRMRLST